MKVLKFGGSSVATAENILKVKSIVEKTDDVAVVVVSALGGVTDELVKTSRLASECDESYKEHLDALRVRHNQTCEALVSDGPRAEELKKSVNALLDELEGICRGVFLLKVIPDTTRDQILSFGERLSSLIVTAAVGYATRYNSLDFIRTEHGLVNVEETNRLIRECFADYKKGSPVAIVPGFIARDMSGEISTLGRGGSDYTASILAAALDASVLEIWTDVDGFMTADPRIIHTSYVIDELSYEEATELCNFGAKVIYPPTVYPVCIKEIPILVKNTFNPAAPGTLIHASDRLHKSEQMIKGISSIDNISLITLCATSMVGIVGVDRHIFTALADKNISVFLVSQSASETGISVGVSSKDAEQACKVLSETFDSEIASGAVNPIKRKDDLAAVAVVGENMKHQCGVAGKLFSTLGRNGISIVALAQGASESNISFVVKSKYLRKSLNVIHDGFFLSQYQELNLFVCGVGVVGGQLIEQLSMQREKLMQENNLKINIVGIARSNRAIFDRNGLDLSSWREDLQHGIETDPARLKSEVVGMNIFNAVFVDCTASADIAALYGDLFRHGVSVVAANKIAASSDYENYRRLKESARDRGVKFLFEANVGAGLPIINTINNLCKSGDRILKIEAVLSGTLNFIFNTISAGTPFSEAVRQAKEQGISEPDPRIDLSGTDVIRKLVILSREAGYKVSREDVEAVGFIPKEFFECSLEEFWNRLPTLDARFEARRKELEAAHKHLRYVATMEDGRCSVALKEVDSCHAFYALAGSNNIVLLTTERYNQHPMLIQGYGAGADVTAAGVFADIISVANV